MTTSSSPTASRTARKATCTMPAGSQAPLPRPSLTRGHPEEDEPGHPERHQPLRLEHERVDRVLHLARHRPDGSGLVDALAHEQRRHQVVEAEPDLGHETSEGGACAAAGAGAAPESRQSPGS